MVRLFQQANWDDLKSIRGAIAHLDPPQMTPLWKSWRYHDEDERYPGYSGVGGHEIRKGPTCTEEHGLERLTSLLRGLPGNREAQTLNMSGAGLPFFTSGSEDPVTTWWNTANWSLRWLVFMRKPVSELLVATAMGTKFRRKCSNSVVTPAVNPQSRKIYVPETFVLAFK